MTDAPPWRTTSIDPRRTPPFVTWSIGNSNCGTETNACKWKLIYILIHVVIASFDWWILVYIGNISMKIYLGACQVVFLIVIHFHRACPAAWHAVVLSGIYRSNKYNSPSKIYPCNYYWTGIVLQVLYCLCHTRTQRMTIVKGCMTVDIQKHLHWHISWFPG